MNCFVADPQVDFARLILHRNVPIRARPFFVRWAKLWSEAVAETESPDATLHFFENLGRQHKIEPWQ